VNDAVRFAETSHGRLAVKPLAPGTLERLGDLFPAVGRIEHEGRDLMALALRHEGRELHGLRSGYGWFEPAEREAASRVARLTRFLLPEALRRFRARGFRGVLLAGACLWGAEGEHSQVGELLFVRADQPLPGASDAVAGYEERFGAGASSVLFAFLTDMAGTWRAEELPARTLTDLEPCDASRPEARWGGDFVLVDDRLVLVWPELDLRDPFLAEIRRRGVEEIEHTPAAFVVGEG
jgi:hypothetical protein